MEYHLRLVNDTFNISNSTITLEMATKGISVSVALVAMLVGFYGNVLILSNGCQSNRPRETIDLLVTNLSGADLLVCVIVSPLFIAIILHNEVDIPTVLCVVHQFLCILCVTVSCLSLDTIAVHRQTRARGQRKTSFRSKIDLGILLSLWCVAALYSAGSLIYRRTDDENKVSICRTMSSGDGGSRQYTLLFMIPVWLSSLLVYFICYSFICYAVTEQGRRGARTRRVRISAEDTILTTKKKTKAVLTCFLVMTEFTLTVGPICLLELLEVVIGTSNVLFQIKTALTPLMFVHSACNPFLYAQQNNAVKRTRKMLRQGIKLRARYTDCWPISRKTELRPVGNGNLESNLRKSLHCTAVVNQRRIMDKAVGPSESIGPSAAFVPKEVPDIFCISGRRHSTCLWDSLKTQPYVAQMMIHSQVYERSCNSCAQVKAAATC